MSQAEALKNQGIELFKKQDFSGAQVAFEEALDAFEEEGRVDMVAEMQVNIALVHRADGEDDEAIVLMLPALQTFEAMGDKLRSAMVLGNLAGAHASMGNKERAHEFYKRAAELFDELGEKDMYADTMLAISELQVRTGSISDGADTYNFALEHKDKLTLGQKIMKNMINTSNRVRYKTRGR